MYNSTCGAPMSTTACQKPHTDFEPCERIGVCKVASKKQHDVVATRHCHQAHHLMHKLVHPLLHVVVVQVTSVLLCSVKWRTMGPVCIQSQCSVSLMDACDHIVKTTTTHDVT